MFVGAALLAVGYQVFMDWIDNAETDTGADRIVAKKLSINKERTE